MFKRCFLLIIAVTVAAACGASPTPAPTASELKLSPPWTGSEHFEYNIVAAKDGAAIGTGTIDVKPANSTTTIEQEYRFDTVVQHNIIQIDPQSLKPISGSQQVTGSKNDYSLATTYAGSALTIKATTAQGDKNLTIQVAPNAIDNDSVLMALRGIPFADGYTAPLNIVVAATALQVPSTLTVAARETLTVPAGTFETYKVALDFGSGSGQTAWFEVAAPHRMIQYANGGEKFVLAKSS